MKQEIANRRALATPGKVISTLDDTLLKQMYQQHVRILETGTASSASSYPPQVPPPNDRWSGYIEGTQIAGTELEKEDRRAWDQYAATTLQNRSAADAAKAADEMLAERRKRFAK